MAMTLLSTSVADGDANLSITSNIDSTYKLYLIKMIGVNPATASNAILIFQANASGQSGFNETITTTYFSAYHPEADSGQYFNFEDGEQVSQGTGYQQIMRSSCGEGADESGVGTLWLFNPSNTTYVKHWYFENTYYAADNAAAHDFIAGYFNVTAAITDIDFKFYNGSNFDGTFKLYWEG